MYVNKFSVNKKKVVAKFDPAFDKGFLSMTLSPDSKSLFAGLQDELIQFSSKDGNVIQSRNINERPDMGTANIYAMRVTRNNQYLVTATVYSGKLVEGPVEDLRRKTVSVGGPVCIWSTKDLTLVKT